MDGVLLHDTRRNRGSRICRIGTCSLILCFVAVALTAMRWTDAKAQSFQESEFFLERIAAGELPQIMDRLPQVPRVVAFDGEIQRIGKPGGEIKTFVGRAKDVRLYVVYGYARLVVYDQDYKIVPDILERCDVEEGRIFTLHLRQGHKWSDGQPFTSEDFRYWWEDVANNALLSPAGPPNVMLVDGKQPTFEVLSETAVRFTWPKPNPYFLPRLASASPLFIYRPAHYLRNFHEKYADPEELQKALKKARRRSWAAVHNRLDNLYRFDNPDLPTLQPWVNKTRPPATRFIGERNPYFHRVDGNGVQLPYIDRLIFNVSDPKLIAAKAGTGEADIQSRGLAFNNYTFLKENEKSSKINIHLWRIAKGAHIALFPNLNHNDPVWRALFRDVRFRRALSLSIDRTIINESLYFGLALEGNNTVLPESPLYNEDNVTNWATYEPEDADELLDEIGLTERDSDNIRLLPDGRRLEMIVETAGEDTEQTDVLELIRENWADVGIKMFIKPSQREVFRNRIFSGETHVSVWGGFENGVPSADSSPHELAPTSQQQLQWPKWGQYFETKSKAGEKPDMPEAEKLAELNRQWLESTGSAEREEIWKQMLAIHADQLFTIGIISGVQQPVVVKEHVVNVPPKGVYNWDPGAHFGIYRPDTFWLDNSKG